MSSKNTVALTFAKNFVISGERKVVKISDIRNATSGKNYSQLIVPHTQILVFKDDDELYCLNKNDQRVSQIFQDFSADSKIEVIEINQKTATEIEFLVDRVIPQMSPSTPFLGFFEELLEVDNADKLHSYFSLEKSQSGSNLPVRIDGFLRFMGSNSPSAPTIARWLKKYASQETITPPTQNDSVVDVSTTPDSNSSTFEANDTQSLEAQNKNSDSSIHAITNAELQPSAAPDAQDIYSELDVVEHPKIVQDGNIQEENDALLAHIEMHEELNTQEQEASRLPSTPQESIENEAQKKRLLETITYDSVFRSRWDQQINKSLSFGQVLQALEKLSLPLVNLFAQRVYNLKSNTPEFDEFVRNFEKHLKEQNVL